MKCKAAPYQGEEAFAFFSYCHADSTVVYPLIEELSRMGYRVWFDDGISIGDEWPEVIAEKLEKCSVFLAAITPAYCRSHNCKNEMTFQVEDGKLILPLMLEDFPLIGGIRLQLSGRQYLKLYDIPTERWSKAISMFEPLVSCKGEPLDIPSAETPSLKIPPVITAPIKTPPVVAPSAENPPVAAPPVNTPPALEISASLMAVQLSDGQLLNASNGQLYLEDGAVCLVWQEDGTVTVSNRNGESTVLDGAAFPSGASVSEGKSFVITVGGSGYAVLWAEAAQWVCNQGKLCFLTSGKTEEVKLILSDGLVLGRSHRWASGAMTDRNISRFHAEMQIQDGSIVLLDHSRNGTYVNGSKVSQASLQDGDNLRLGMEAFGYHEIPVVDPEAVLREHYAEAQCCMASAVTREDFLQAAEMFAQLDSFLDSQAQRQACLAQAENIRKEGIYAQAKADAAGMEPEKLEQAIAALVSLGDWKDAKHLAEEYTERLHQRRAMEQAYQEACRMLEQADSEAALTGAEKCFVMLGNYRDSGLMQLRCREKLEEFRRKAAAQKDADKHRMLCQDPSRADENTKYDEDEPTVMESSRASMPHHERLILVDLRTGEAFEGKPQSTVLGRKSNQCDISFPGSSTMSRRHAEIFTFNGSHYIRDCHSANGTTVDGQRLETDQTVKVGNTATLTIAGIHFLVAFDEAAYQIARKKTAMVLFEQNTQNTVLITDTPVPFTTVDMDATVVEGLNQKTLCAQIWLANADAVLDIVMDDCVWINGVGQKGGSRTLLQKGSSVQIGEDFYQLKEIPVVFL